MKLVIRSAANVGSRVRIGDHDLIFDQPRTVPGGQDHGPSPLDVLVASIGACAHYYAAAFLHARDVSTGDLSVDIEAEKEQTPAPRVARFRITIRVPAGLTEQQLTGIERAVRRCPAYGTLMHPPSVEIVVGGADTAEMRRSA
jgi:putative redox protein